MKYCKLDEAGYCVEFFTRPQPGRSDLVLMADPPGAGARWVNEAWEPSTAMKLEAARLAMDGVFDGLSTSSRAKFWSMRAAVVMALDSGDLEAVVEIITGIVPVGSAETQAKTSLLAGLAGLSN